MEIIGRFPAVGLDEPGVPPPKAAVRPADPVKKEPAPPRAWRGRGQSASRPAVAFPIRSLAVLAVLTAVVWVMAFRNDAARRRAADGAAAATIASDPRESVAK